MIFRIISNRWLTAIIVLNMVSSIFITFFRNEFTDDLLLQAGLIWYAHYLLSIVHAYSQKRWKWLLLVFLFFPLSIVYGTWIAGGDGSIPNARENKHNMPIVLGVVLGFTIGMFATGGAMGIVMKKAVYDNQLYWLGEWEKSAQSAYESESPETAIWALQSMVDAFDSYADYSPRGKEVGRKLATAYSRMYLVATQRLDDSDAGKRYLKEASRWSELSSKKSLTDKHDIVQFLKANGYTTK